MGDVIGLTKANGEVFALMFMMNGAHYYQFKLLIVFHRKT